MKNRDFQKILGYLGIFRNFWGCLEIFGGTFREKIENFRIDFQSIFFGYLCLGLRGVYIERCPNGYLCPKKCCPWTSRPTGWGCCNLSNGVCCDGAIDGKCCPKSLRCRTFFFPAFFEIILNQLEVCIYYFYKLVSFKVSPRQIQK